MSRVALCVCAIAVTIALGSCRGSDIADPQSRVVAVNITGAPLEGVLPVGDSLALAALANDAVGRLVGDAPIGWTSSNPTIATVSTRGVVTGRKPGATTIRATSGTAFDTTALSIRVAIVPPSPGAAVPTVSTVLDGQVTLFIPPGAVPAGVARITVGPALAPPASGELVTGTAFDFGPSGTQFSSPLTLSIVYDPAMAGLPNAAGLAIYHVTGGDYEEVEGSVVDVAINRVSASISSFSSYAVLRRATPASIAASAGDRQTTSAGAPVPVRPAVRVLDARGRPIRMAPVVFVAVSGDGSVSGAAQLTDKNGVAAVESWTLGRAAGENKLSAQVAGLAPVVFTATGLAPARLAITAQPVSTTAGATFANVIVKAQDVNGNTAAGFTGLISLALGNAGLATLGGVTKVNAVAGVATFSNLVVNRPGNGYTLIASTEGLTSATSTAFNIAIGPPALITLGSGGDQLGIVNSPLPRAVVVRVTDAAGNPIPDNRVDFAVSSGGGSVTPTSAPTNKDGQASTVWTLGPTTGAQSISATAGTVTITVNATAQLPPPPPPPQVATYLLIVSGADQSGSPNAPLAQPIVVQVADATRRPIADAGRTVTFTVETGGGTVQPATTATMTDGRASATWTLGSVAGIQRVTVSSPGLVSITVNATATTPGLVLYTEYDYYYSLNFNPDLGIGQLRTVYVATQNFGIVTSPLTIALSHSGTTISIPATVTIPASASEATFDVTGVAQGGDGITASAAGYGSASASVSVGKGTTYLSLLATLHVGETVPVDLYVLSPNQYSGVTVTAPTTFTLTSNANIQFVSAATAGTPITSITVPANGYSVQLWIKGVAAGSGSFAISNALYQTHSNTVAVVP